MPKRGVSRKCVFYYDRTRLKREAMERMLMEEKSLCHGWMKPEKYLAEPLTAES